MIVIFENIYKKIHLLLKIWIGSCHSVDPVILIYYPQTMVDVSFIRFMKPFKNVFIVNHIFIYVCFIFVELKIAFKFIYPSTKKFDTFLRNIPDICSVVPTQNYGIFALLYVLRTMTNMQWKSNFDMKVSDSSFHLCSLWLIYMCRILTTSILYLWDSTKLFGKIL